MTEFTIIGGNVAGMSAALHLHEKGHEVHVYEKEIWNKPCGGGFTIDFHEYLQERWQITLDEAHRGRDVVVGLPSGKHVRMESPFVVTTRKELQEKLIRRAKSLGISVTLTGKRLSFSEILELATPQTIIATGYSKLSIQALNQRWDPRDVAHIVRYDGKVTDSSYPDDHIVIIDNKVLGYGWLFIGDHDRINVGIGGESKSLPSGFSWKQYFNEFLAMLKEKYQVFINDELKFKGWKLPLPYNKWKYNVSNIHDGIEFIGVGDTLGLAHPLLGAGIEPAWLSGKCLAAAISPSTGKIDTRKYQELLRKNIELTSCRKIDQILARLLRKPIPKKNALTYYTLKFLKHKMLNEMLEKPWFIMHQTA